jgi:S-adenosylmethionine-dependent methyltransferase
MSHELVRNYYAAFAENEWHRLDSPVGAIEFAVTTAALAAHLPARGHILDLGGGPGRYSLWLAERGYTVVLADISPDLLAIARAKIAETDLQAQVVDVITCDACDLSRFGDHAFDAILALGPFYHLVDPADRHAAASELVRVVKPGGAVFVAFMPVYNFLYRTLLSAEERHHLAQPAFIARLMNEGVFRNDVPGRFNAGYGVRPQDVPPFMERYGLETVSLLTDTGLAGPYAQALQQLLEVDPNAYEAAMALILQTASDTSILGAGSHLIYVGRKRP